MNKREMVLVSLAPGAGSLHSPVQVQKLLFLLDRNITAELGGPFFAFIPYNYGPFDKGVYEVLEQLAQEGLVELAPERTWTDYRLTVNGQQAADTLLAELPEWIREYVAQASQYVRSLSFAQLVSAIYRAYPEMRVNSVFEG